MSRLILFVLILFAAATASAQDCAIAPYGDPEGTQSWLHPVEAQQFSVYVVIQVENTVAAAAYSLDCPVGMFLQARFFGPSGDGLAIDEPTGTSVAFTECAIGFGSAPVLVDEYQFVVFPGSGYGIVSIGPNASQDPDYPQYVTCNGITSDCMFGPDLVVGSIIPTDATNFSAIKSLYH